MREAVQSRKFKVQILAAFVALIFCAVANPRGSAQSVHLPPHQKVALKNGLTLLLMEKHGVPIIDLSAIVKTGGIADPSGKEGLASTTAALLRKGTAKRSAQQFAADMDFIGGSFDADAGPDFTRIDAEFLTKDLVSGLDLFTDAVLHPTFPQAEVDKLLAQSIDAVRAAKDEPQAVLGSYYAGYLFLAHPYGRPTGGDELSLKRIHRDDVASFYASNYAPGNTILAVSGEFNATEMQKKLEEVLGTWLAKTVASATLPVPPVSKGKRLLLVDKPDASQTYFAIGNVGVAQNDPDRVAISVVNTIFGGRFTSELNEALRVESGYTYGVQSMFQRRRVAGPFGIFSFTKNETTVPAIDLALQILDKLHKNGVTAEQLASAKSYIKGQFPPNVETSAQLASLIAVHEFYGLGDDETNQFEARVDAVTPEMAKQVIEKHFPAENLVFVLIGKASAIGPAVEKYASKRDGRAISEPGYWPPPAAAAK
jgi:predicted Zn-dependent peptidase